MFHKPSSHPIKTPANNISHRIMDTNYYYLGSDKQPRGPISKAELLKMGNELIHSGKNLVYCQEGDKEWKNFDETFNDISAPAGQPVYPKAITIPLMAIYFYVVAAVTAIVAVVLFGKFMENARYLPNDFIMYAVGAFVLALLWAGCLVGCGYIATTVAKMKETKKP